MRVLLLLPLLLIVGCCPKDPLQKGLERFSKVALEEVTYYNDELIYYIWEPDNGRRKRVFKEEYSEAFGRAFGHPIEWCTGAGDD